MTLFVAVGECMVELSAAKAGLWHLGIAGDTLNTAWYARAFLPESWEVSYVTRLGRDAFSDRAAAFIAQNGIATRHITRHPTRSIGLYAIALTDGERRFAYWRDRSAARRLMAPGDGVATALAGAAVIYVSGVTLAILPPGDRLRLLDILGQQRARGALCVLDPNYRPALWPDAKTARRMITAAARTCSIVLPGFDDEAALFGDAEPAATRARYVALGARMVVVKNGGKSIAIADDGKDSDLNDLPTVTPLDTTGAGDAFNGAFLAAIVAGQPPAIAARSAHGVAMRVVSHRGALIPMADLRRVFAPATG